MKKLSELSLEYSASESAIAQRIAELKEKLSQTDDPIKAGEFQRRIRDLRPLQRQSRELSDLTKHYYDWGYYRDPKYTCQSIGGCRDGQIRGS